MTSRKQLGTSTRSRAIARLNKTLDKDLLAYIAAASAAGVGMLALARSAEAEIVYTPANIHINNNTSAVLDFNHDGINDFQIQSMTETVTTTTGLLGGQRWRRRGSPQNRHLRPPEGTQGAFLTVFPLQQSDRAYEVQSHSSTCAAALRKGVKVGPHSPFQPSTSYLNMAWSQAGQSGCPWRPVKQAYLGVKFVVRGEVHFGWARIKRVSGRGFPAIITGYAYETIANKSIVTGKTHGPDVIRLGPATLGHLAQGASGLSAGRRADSVAATH